MIFSLFILSFLAFVFGRIGKATGLGAARFAGGLLSFFFAAWALIFAFIWFIGFAVNVG